MKFQVSHPTGHKVIEAADHLAAAKTVLGSTAFANGEDRGNEVVFEQKLSGLTCGVLALR